MSSRAALSQSAIFVLLFALVVALQWRGGAYQADLGSSPDEPAHYVTGLMMRDYIATFPWQSPMPFATDFYAHYPMVAIGHWPPLFYLVQALWMLPFGESRVSILLLMATISSVTATILFHAWRPLFGAAVAGTLAVCFLIAPVVQEYSRAVMAETVVTLLAVLATLSYARYLQTERALAAILFGLTASAAILTKPTGLALGLLPPLAVIAARKLYLVKRGSFWLPLLIVLPLCGPWYILTADLARDGWTGVYDPSWLLRHPAAHNAMAVATLAGVPVFVAALAGLALAARSQPVHESRALQMHLAAMAALLVSTLVFLSFVVPVQDRRHLIPALPALLALAVAATLFLARGARLPLVRRAATAVLVVAALGTLAVQAARVRPKPRTGADAAAALIASRPELSHSVFLVSSEGFGEAVFIAELAALDERPEHRVLRASKVLSTSTWDGSDYRLTYATPEEVHRFLTNAHVDVVVIDTKPMEGPHSRHHRQLLSALHEYRDDWVPIVSDAAAASDRFRVLRVARRTPISERPSALKSPEIR
jgi:4-amino-4-deoxy-L-arabinose transferase-like glycosyltransferase